MSEKMRMKAIMDEEGKWVVTTPDAKRTYRGRFDSEEGALTWIATKEYASQLLPLPTHKHNG